MQDWTTLTCACGSQRFTELVELRWHPANGSTTRPGGYRCGGCDKRVDMRELINVVKENQLQTKIKELQADIVS